MGPRRPQFGRGAPAPRRFASLFNQFIDERFSETSPGVVGSAVDHLADPADGDELSVESTGQLVSLGGGEDLGPLIKANWR